MKKSLLLFGLLLLFARGFAQDTITGWTFPVNTGPDSLNANLGTDQNKAYDLRFQWVINPTTDSTLNTIVFYDDAGNFAAETDGWDNGADVKFWSIKFKAANYKNFKVSSRQKGESGFPGPRDFKLQWRLSATTYADVPEGTVTLGYDYTSGTVTNLPVPIADQGTSSVYIRWIMASNTGIDGTDVLPTGRSIIDDILVTGTSTLGEEEILFTNRIKFNQVNHSGQFTVESTFPMSGVSVTDLQGKVLRNETAPGLNASIDLGPVSKGIYLLTIRFTDSDKPCTRKFVVQ